MERIGHRLPELTILVLDSAPGGGAELPLRPEGPDHVTQRGFVIRHMAEYEARQDAVESVCAKRQSGNSAHDDIIDPAAAGGAKHLEGGIEGHHYGSGRRFDGHSRGLA